MANSIIGTRSPNGNVGVRGVVDSGELSIFDAWTITQYQSATSGGVLQGFGLVSSGSTVTAGGVTTIQDVCIGRNSSGESDLLVGNGPGVTFSLGGAPETSGQSRIDALVVWKDTTVVSTQNDGYDAVSYTVVAGTTALNPVPPTEAQIRSAITNGSTAMLAVIGTARSSYGSDTPTSLTTNYAKIDVNNIDSSRVITRTFIDSGSTDINTLVSTGDYMLGSGTTMNNNPLGQVPVWVEVRTYATGASQRLQGYDAPSQRIFIRRYTTSWSPWVEISSGTTTVGAITSRGITINYARSGGTVTITLFGNLLSGWVSGQVLGTIPSGFRPYYDYNGGVIRSVGGMKDISITSSGSIMSTEDFTTGSGITGTLTYVAR